MKMFKQLCFFAMSIVSLYGMLVGVLHADDIDIYVSSDDAGTGSGLGGGSIYDDGADASFVYVLDSSGSMHFDVRCSDNFQAVGTQCEVGRDQFFNLGAYTRRDVMRYAFSDFISAVATNTKIGAFKYYDNTPMFDTQYLNYRTPDVRPSEFQLDWEDEAPEGADDEEPYDINVDRVREGCGWFGCSFDSFQDQFSREQDVSPDDGRVGDEERCRWWGGCSITPDLRNVIRFTLPNTVDNNDLIELTLAAGGRNPVNLSVRIYFVQSDSNRLSASQVYNTDGYPSSTINFESGIATLDISQFLSDGHWTAGQRGFFILERDDINVVRLPIAGNSSFIRITPVSDDADAEVRDTLKIPVQTIGSDVVEISNGKIFDTNTTDSNDGQRTYNLEFVSDYAGKRSVNPAYDNTQALDITDNPLYRYDIYNTPAIGFEVNDTVDTDIDGSGVVDTNDVYRSVFSIDSSDVSAINNQLLNIDELTFYTGLNDSSTVSTVQLYFFQTDQSALTNADIRNYVFNDSAMQFLGDVEINQFGNAVIVTSDNEVGSNVKSLFSKQTWSPGEYGYFVVVNDSVPYESSLDFSGSYVRATHVGGGTNLNLKSGNKVGLRFISVPVEKGTSLRNVSLVLYPKSNIKPNNLFISLADGAPSRLFKNSDGYLSTVSQSGPVSDRVAISLSDVEWRVDQEVKVSSPELTTMIQELLNHEDSADNPNKEWYYEGGISLIVESDSSNDVFIHSFDNFLENGRMQAQLHLSLSNPESYVSHQTHRGRIIQRMKAFGAGGGTPISPAYYNAVEELVGLDDGVSPIVERAGSDQCRISNSVIVLTDGAETTADEDSPVSTYDNPPFNISCSGGGGDYWDCTNQLAKTLFNDGYEVNGYGYDTQIKSYGIVFGNEFEVIPKVSTYAQYGGTNAAYQVASGAQLVELFESLAEDIKVDAATIAAPSVSINALNRFQNSDELYYALFKPEPHVAWGGNLKRYSLREGRIVGADLLHATELVERGTSTVTEFSSDSISWWNENASPDGGVVELGGAKMRLDSGRKIYTYIEGDADFGSKILADNEITATAFPDEAEFALDEETVNYMRDGSVRWGAAIHNSPVLVNYSKNNGEPINTLFAGDNAGFLHAINTGEPTNLNDSGYNLNNSGGNEIYSFVPQELLSNFADLKAKRTAGVAVNGYDKYVYGVDGKISLLRKDADYDGDVTEDGDKVNLYFGLRRGGNAYYGLNVKQSFNRALVRFWASPKDHVVIEPDPTFVGTETVTTPYGDVIEDRYTRALASDYPEALLSFKAQTQKGGTDFDSATIEIFDEYGNSVKTCPYANIGRNARECNYSVAATSDIAEQLKEGASYVVRRFTAVFSATVDGAYIEDSLESVVGFYPYTSKDQQFELPCDNEDNLIRGVCIKEVYGENANPRLLFRKSPDSGGAWARLGQTWSPMTPFKVMWNGVATDVLIFGGGYDPEANETINGTYKAFSSNPAIQQGNAVYIIHAQNGNILGVVSASLSGGRAENHADMTFSIPGEVTGRDTNLDAAVDMLYAADLGGQVFRIDLNPAAGSTTKLIQKVHTIAKLGVTDQAGGNESNHRRFFEGPAVAFLETGERAGDHMIAIGSGYRPDVKNNDVQDHMYVIYDKDASAKGLSSEPETITLSDLEDVTDKDSASNEDEGGMNGWYIALDKTIGEKVTGTPLIFAKRVGFVTYTNSTAGSGEVCTPDLGSSRSYFVNQNSSPLSDNGDRILKDNIPGLIDTGRLLVTEVDGETTIIKLDGASSTCLAGNCGDIVDDDLSDPDDPSDPSNPSDPSDPGAGGGQGLLKDLVPDFGAIMRGRWRQCNGVDSSICGGAVQ